MANRTARNGSNFVVVDSDSASEDDTFPSGRSAVGSSRVRAGPRPDRHEGRTTPRSRVMRLLADSSPDTSLPSFRDMIQRHKSQLADSVSIDVDPSRATSDLAISAKVSPSARTGSMRRIISSPDGRAAIKRQKIVPPRDSAVEIIELGSDSVVDPATSQDLRPDVLDISSPIRMVSSQPLSNSRTSLNKTVSAPIVVFSSSPSPGRTSARFEPEPVMPTSSLPLPISSQSRPSSPILQSPTRQTATNSSISLGAKRGFQRTKSLLDALDDLHEEPSPNETYVSPPAAHEPLFFASQSTVDGQESSSSKNVKPATKEPASPSRSKAAKQAAKVAREAKKQEKELAKQAKLTHAEERKRWKEVNKLRSSKAETMREMIVDLDSGLFAPGQPLASSKDSIKARLEEQGALRVCFNDTIVTPPLIRFRRTVKAVWNSERRHWTPLDREQVVVENTAIVYVDAKEVIDLVGSDGLVEWYQDLHKRLTQSSSDTATDFQIFLVVQGLIKYYAKLKASENRAYAARIRSQLAQEAGEGSTADVAHAEADASRAAAKGKEKMAISAPQEDVERALLHLKFVHRCYVVHVGALIDGIEWIHQLTSDISIRPYKALRDSHLTFAVETGKGTTASESPDIWSMMLQQIPRVTASIAASITTVYPTLPSLVQAYKQCRDQTQQNQLLSTIQISTNVDGTERRGNRANLGLQLSKRICAVLQSRNGDLLINNPTKD